jgi:hypothetical protein
VREKGGEASILTASLAKHRRISSCAFPAQCAWYWPKAGGDRSKAVQLVGPRRNGDSDEASRLHGPCAIALQGWTATALANSGAGEHPCRVRCDRRDSPGLGRGQAP